MIIPSRLPEYIVAAMVIILAPGPSVLFVIARAIAWGKTVKKRKTNKQRKKKTTRIQKTKYNESN